MYVLKFGGTSVADREAVVRLVEIVRRVEDRRVVVVVSALGGVTDELLHAASRAGEGDEESAHKTVRRLHDRHLVVAGAIADPAQRAVVEQTLALLFADLARILSALSVLHEVSLRWLDTVAAIGELASSHIVTAALTSAGLPAAWVDARDVIVTSDQHTAAIPDLVATQTRVAERVGPLVAAGRIAVMGGFVGATSAGVTTTVGRGGSDYSAALVGACLAASEIQIWTDVDGMLTADPRLVPHARLVPRLSFAEASELAYFGAKVLHPETIAPAMAKGIPVRILNSRRPDGAGTLVTAERESTGCLLTAVACKRDVAVIDIASTRMLMAHGFLHKLFGVFEKHATSVDVVTTSEVSVSVTVDNTQYLPQIVNDLSAFSDVTRHDGMAVLCAVGEGVHGDSSLVGRLARALEPIPIRMLSQAADRRNITIVIPDTHVAAALDQLHAEFFGDGPLAGGVAE